METPPAPVLLVPYGLAGHLGPMAVLGAALRTAGHAVTVLVTEDDAAGFTQAGFATWTPRRWRPDAPVPAGLLASGNTGAVFRHLILGSIADITLDVEEALRETGATVVVGDVFMPGAGLAADRTGVPWVSIACSPVPAVDSYRMFIDPLMLEYFEASATLEELGVPARPESLLGRISPYLHLIPVTPSFAGAEAVAALPEQVRLVGPLVPDRTGTTAAARPSLPMVIVATSSNTWQRMGDGARRQQRSLRVAARALAGMDVTAVLIIPPGASTELLGPPAPNVRRTGLLAAEEFDALIDTCSAIVSHGGWGTAARALTSGLPLVVIPTSIDQPYVAQRCDELGLGIALDPLTATPAQFRAAVEAVCGDPRYRRAALDFAAELRAATPAATAASLISALTEQLSTSRG